MVWSFQWKGKTAHHQDDRIRSGGDFLIAATHKIPKSAAQGICGHDSLSHFIGDEEYRGGDGAGGDAYLASQGNHFLFFQEDALSRGRVEQIVRPKRQAIAEYHIVSGVAFLGSFAGLSVDPTEATDQIVLLFPGIPTSPPAFRPMPGDPLAHFLVEDGGGRDE